MGQPAGMEQRRRRLSARIGNTRGPRPASQDCEHDQAWVHRMWIVRIALDRPYTFIVLALLILIASPVVILRTPTDIFPNINIPVIAVAWQFTGLNPEEMEGRITTVYERVLTTLVDNIEHIESTTINGQGIVKVFLQPSARLDRANAP